MRLKIENTEKKFRVHVLSKTGAELYSCGWHGGEFQYDKEWYGVFGPYHGLDGDHFRLYKLVPQTDAM